MSTGREFWRCCIIIIPLLSKHKPPHQPRRCDAVWGHNRNMPQPSGVGGWGGENRACFSKPCRCRRTDSLGSPFDTSEMQPWGSFHRKASYGPLVEVPQSWAQSLPILPETPGIHSVFHGQSMHLRVPVGVILWLWLDEGVVAIHYLAIPHNHYAHGANAAALTVGCLKIYCCKIFHVVKVSCFKYLLKVATDHFYCYHHDQSNHSSVR